MARGLHELGSDYMVDLCCRTHDLCSTYIEPGEQKYGIRNDNELYTMVSCECDQAFYNCLNDVNTTSSSKVTFGYSRTYPTCILTRPRLVCKSPDNNYDKNPCKDNRNPDSTKDTNLCPISESTCKIYSITDEFTIADSQFKLHQQRLDEQHVPDMTEEFSLVPSVFALQRDEIDEDFKMGLQKLIQQSQSDMTELTLADLNFYLLNKDLLDQQDEPDPTK